MVFVVAGRSYTVATQIVVSRARTVTTTATNRVSKGNAGRGVMATVTTIDGGPYLAACGRSSVMCLEYNGLLRMIITIKAWLI